MMTDQTPQTDTTRPQREDMEQAIRDALDRGDLSYIAVLMMYHDMRYDYEIRRQ